MGRPGQTYSRQGDQQGPRLLHGKEGVYSRTGKSQYRKSRMDGMRVETAAEIRNPLETLMSLDDILCCKDFRGT